MSKRDGERRKVGRKINEIRNRGMNTRQREKISSEVPNNLEASENTHRNNYAEHVTSDALRVRDEGCRRKVERRMEGDRLLAEHEETAFSKQFCKDNNL